MMKWVLNPRIPVTAGIVVLAACLLALLLVPRSWTEILREQAFDLVFSAEQQIRPHVDAGSDARVVVVDIDRHSIEVVGAWPWPRETLARLIEAVAAAAPAAIAVDILFAEPDTRSPAALARRLGALTGRSDLALLADELIDGDKRLAETLRRVPVALGFVLDPDGTGVVLGTPVIASSPLPLRGLWSAAGAVGPVSTLEQAADGTGALSLPGDADGLTRRVPLFVGAAETLLPGLALEAVRLARGASAYVIRTAPPKLAAGDLEISLPPDALLRLIPKMTDAWSGRTLSAADLMAGHADAVRIRGAVVLIGGSAPELGGLRQTVSDPLTPSVQIQADAVLQILAGQVPQAIDDTGFAAMALVLATGVLAIVAGTALPPLAGVMATLSVVGSLWVAALGLAVFNHRLLDSLTPSATTAVVFVAVAAAAYAVIRRREALLRRRFEQHLAPAVVRRIVEHPELMKLSGERREVTALFTDIEGFTALTHRADPEQLIAVLDEYFEEAAAIIVGHGGMVDKIVGDAIHALFNAPIDLPDHPLRAVECATALSEWAKDYRSRAAPAVIGLGRTRIGLETGPVVVGDVGIRTKLDYTAHGDAINTAARLEAANKDLGSTICVGATAAMLCGRMLFRPLGMIVVRGREEALAVFEPWPKDAPQSWRDRYLGAFCSIDQDPLAAATLFDQLATERPDDPVARLMAIRIRAQSAGAAIHP